MTEENGLLKQDILGRVTVSREQREKILDAFEASGMSGSEFAKQHGIKVQTFATWIQKRRRSRGDYQNEETRRKLRMGKMGKKRSSQKQKADSSQAFQLIEVELTEQNASITEALEVVLPSGVQIRVRCSSQISLLKSVLKELSC